ncbi:unnamed protein product [Lactuca saligna]|uniref:Uncharacterized protein n=1 Tax=Lactuca saligna TaxID=75948 RepID=A0AA35V1E4_LACSI|nr:unnamed protein product [Lactuca saligna]
MKINNATDRAAVMIDPVNLNPELTHRDDISPSILVESDRYLLSVHNISRVDFVSLSEAPVLNAWTGSYSHLFGSELARLNQIAEMNSTNKLLQVSIAEREEERMAPLQTQFAQATGSVTHVPICRTRVHLGALGL